MEENGTNNETSGSSAKWMIPAAVVGLLVLAVVAFFLMGQSKTAPTQQEAMQAAATPTAPVATQTQTQGAMTEAEYKDGEYKAVGQYVSPGGPRDVDVIVTLEKGVVTDATFLGHATDPNSKRFQEEFKENFASEVVGKNIDEVKVTKVAGSSLSPKGFMDALEKIKEEAKA